MDPLKKTFFKGLLLAALAMSPFGMNALRAEPYFESENVSVQPVIGIGVDFGYPGYYYYDSPYYYGSYRPYYYSPYYNYYYYPYYGRNYYRW